MKRKLLAGLLCLCMIISILPVSALAAGADGIVAAPLHDTRLDGDNPKEGIANDKLYTAGSYTVEAPSEGGGSGTQADPYKINISAVALRKHENADRTPAMGFWVGAFIPAVGEVTTAKYAFQKDTIAADATLNDLNKLETVDGKQGIAFYADANSADAKKNIAVQWGGTGDITYYTLDFTGVKCAYTITVKNGTAAPATVDAKNSTISKDGELAVVTAADGYEAATTQELKVMMGTQDITAKVTYDATTGKVTAKEDAGLEVTDDIVISGLFVEQPAKTDPTITPAETTASVKVGESKEITVNTDGTVTVDNANEAIAKGEADGKKVTIRGVAAGTANVTIKAAAGTTNNAKDFVIAVTVIAADPVVEKITVKFNLNGKETTAIPDQEVAVGEKVTKPTDPTVADFKFKGWATTQSATTADVDFDTYTVAKPADGTTITLYAVWEALPDVTVKFVAGYDNAPAITPATGKPGTEVSLPTDPTRTGFAFLGWKATGSDTLITGTKYTIPANATGEITLTAQWNPIQTSGIQAGFEWNGDTANEKINAAIKTADKTKEISDSLDQTYWMLINEPITSAKHYYYEIKLGDAVLQEGKFEGTDSSTGILYFSFLMSRDNPNNKVIKANDVLTFNLWSDTATINTKPKTDPVAANTETVKVGANTLAIGDVTPDVDAKTVNVKFSDHLYGRYYIALEKDGTAGDVAHIATECDRAQADAGIKQTVGATFTDVTLTEGTYAVKLYQRNKDTATAAKVGEAIATKADAVVLYKVEFKNGDTAVGTAKYVKAGEKVTAEAAVSADGKTFTGWKAGDKTVEAAGEYTVAAADATNYVITFTAQFAKNITVKFDLNGKTATPIESQKVAVGRKVTKPTAPEVAGYIFKGWATSATAKDVIDFETYTVAEPATGAEITLYAVWESDSIVSAKLKKDDETVAGATVTPAVDNAKATLTISGIIPAIVADTADTYTLSYRLASQEKTDADKTVTVKFAKNNGKITIASVTGAGVTNNKVVIGDNQYEVVVGTDLLEAEIQAATPEVKPAPADKFEGKAEDKATVDAHFGTNKPTVSTDDGLVAAAAAMVVSGSEDKAVKALVTELEKEDRALEVYLDITPVGYVPNAGSQSLKLTITPMVRVVEVKENSSTAPVKGVDPVPVSNFDGTKSEPVTITVPVPTNFIKQEDTGNVYVRHSKAGALIEIIKATATTTDVTFTAGSFSEYEIVVDTRTVTVTFDGTPKTITPASIGKSITDIITDATTDDDAKEFVGWGTGATDASSVVIKKGATIDDALLNTLIAKANGNTLALVAVFTPKQTPPTGTGPSVPTYSVKADAAENGKVSVSRTSASKGTTVTITATPDEGYKVGTVAVKDAKGNDVEVKAGTDGKYTFTMPDANVTVTVTFVEDTVELPFTDLNTEAWYMDAIKYVVKEGFFNGTSDTTFAPNSNMTRGMFVTVLYRMAGEPEVTGENKFSDVEAGKYYTDAVIWASENEIVKGYDDGTFKPEKNVTRAEMVTFMHRYAKLCELDMTATDDLSAFTDKAEVPEWALEAMQWAVGAKIVKGTSDTTLASGNTSTRAQVAQIVSNLSEFNAK